MKKHYILSIALIISLLFGTYSSIIQEQQKQTANKTLRHYLSEAGTCFGVDYTKLDDESKIYYYMKVSANLNTAIYIVPFTSYANNQDLINALSGLYLSITVQSTPESNNRWVVVTEKRQAIFENLHYISLNPNEKSNCKALLEILNDIGY